MRTLASARTVGFAAAVAVAAAGVAATGGCATASPVADAGAGGGVADATASAPDGASPPVDAIAASDAAPKPDARPPVDAAAPVDAAPVIDASCSDTIVNLLANGHFDLGPGGGWIELSGYTPPFPLIVPQDTDGVASDDELPPGLPAQSPTYASWLGGVDSTTDVLYQDFAVPAGATGVQVVGYLTIATEETGPYDVASIQLRSTSGALLESLVAWDSADVAPAWTAFFATPAGAYAGQTLRLQLTSTTDFIFGTSFFFDTVEVRALVCL
jgi:hypothetical protein